MRFSDKIGDEYVLMINVTKIKNWLKNRNKKKKYEWIYECYIENYQNYCVPKMGSRSDPYCKHGLRLLKREVFCNG